MCFHSYFGQISLTVTLFPWHILCFLFPFLFLFFLSFSRLSFLCNYFCFCVFSPFFSIISTLVLPLFLYHAPTISFPSWIPCYNHINMCILYLLSVLSLHLILHSTCFEFLACLPLLYFSFCQND